MWLSTLGFFSLLQHIKAALSEDGVLLDLVGQHSRKD